MKPAARTQSPARTNRRPKARLESYRKGRLAEAFAARFLTDKDYRRRARRFRSPMGEIDLIAGRRIAFIEVESRATWQEGAWSVTPRQQAGIARAAEAWRKRNPHHADRGISFDVVLLAPRSLPRHITDAYRV